MLSTVVSIPEPIKADAGGVIAAANYSDVPVRTVCPQCRKTVMSQVTETIGVGTWLIALILLLLPPLCFIPFFVKGCKDKEHRCPSCGNLLGIIKVVG